jgi:hypothetical protein
MSIEQVSDEELLNILEKAKEPVFEELRTIVFTFGNVFYIWMSADGPPGAEKLTDITDFAIEIYHWRPMPPAADMTMDPIEFDTPEKKYKFEFDVKVFPHIAIDPRKEEHFKDQPWAKLFGKTNGFGYGAKSLDPHTFCDIVRYCYKLSKLRAFW